MNNKEILLRGSDKSFPGLSLKYGEALLVIAPPPTDGRVCYISANRERYYCAKLPCWVKCVAYNCSRKDINLINSNMQTFQDAGLFVGKAKPISHKDIDVLEGGEIRLMNIISLRLKQEDFLEVNLVGLAFDSIRRILRYIVDDISHNKVAYVVVNYSDIVLMDNNFMYINDMAINDIIKELEMENDIKKKKMQELS